VELGRGSCEAEGRCEAKGQGAMRAVGSNESSWVGRGQVEGRGRGEHGSEREIWRGTAGGGSGSQSSSGHILLMITQRHGRHFRSEDCSPFDSTHAECCCHFYCTMLCIPRY